MLKTILNPYEHFSEKKIFAFGVLITLLGSWVAFVFNARFDGVIDMHTFSSIKMYQPFLDNGINIICLLIPLYILGWFVNRKTRVVDILNAVLFSRIPFFFLPLFNFNDRLIRNEEELMSSIMKGSKLEFWQILDVTLFAAVAISALVLFVFWLYKGFKTATNSKKLVHKFLFAGCVILAEIFSKIIFSSI